MHFCAAICFHGCVCKDSKICTSLHGEPESHNGMLISAYDGSMSCSTWSDGRGLRECRS